MDFLPARVPPSWVESVSGLSIADKTEMLKFRSSTGDTFAAARAPTLDSQVDAFERNRCGPNSALATAAVQPEFCPQRSCGARHARLEN